MQAHTLTNSEGLPLRFELRQPEGTLPRAVVVICHGFKGFKQWGFFPYLADRVAEAGWAAITLDFSGNGIGDDPVEFTRLDLFAANTYSKEIADLEQVLDWAADHVETSHDAIGLVAHSRAAVPAMVIAREQGRIGALVTWAGVGRLLRITERQRQEWERNGVIQFVNARTGQEMAMNYDFVRDIEANAERFSLEEAARRMKAAHLILHGTGDLAVPVEEAELLRAGRTPEEGCEVVKIEGASHTFGAVHPFAGTTPHLEEAITHTLGWFDRHLDGPPR